MRDPQDPGTRELPGLKRGRLAADKKAGGAAPHRIGYMRVSTADQSMDLQRDELQRAGCSTIYEEHASGKSKERPELANMLKALRSGDTVVVWKLDRLGRSLSHLVQIMEDLAERGVMLESVTQKLDTSSATGKMFVQFFALLAEWERNLISERTHAGLKAARARGRKGGAPAKLSIKDVREAKALLRDPTITVTDVAKRLKVSRGTIYNHLNKAKPLKTARG